MKLICKLLAYVECHYKSDPLPVPEIEGYDEDEVHYHVKLCSQAGYFEFLGMGGIDGGLTWLGHEALERLRNGLR